MNEHKYDEHENIEKKVDIFHILNGILAIKIKKSNILKKVSWSYRGFVGGGEWSFQSQKDCSIPRANRDFQLISREKRGRLGMLLSLRRS